MAGLRDIQHQELSVGSDTATWRWRRQGAIEVREMDLGCDSRGLRGRCVFSSVGYLLGIVLPNSDDATGMRDHY
jgi:hypothetical protein